MCQKQRISCPSRIETRIDMEEGIAQPSLGTRGSRIDDGTVCLDVSYVEELIVLEAVDTTCFVVGFDVV